MGLLGIVVWVALHQQASPTLFTDTVCPKGHICASATVIACEDGEAITINYNEVIAVCVERKWQRWPSVPCNPTKIETTPVTR